MSMEGHRAASDLPIFKIMLTATWKRDGHSRDGLQRIVKLYQIVKALQRPDILDDWGRLLEIKRS